MYFLKFLVFSIILFHSAFSSAAVKFYQSSKVHNNGSMSMTFTYSAKESDLKDNKIGNLPFAIEDVRQFFYSADSEIKKSLAYKDPSDNSISAVTVDIEIRDINKISQITGLNNFKTVWMKSDTGMVFTFLIPASFINTNLIDTYQFILTFEDKVRSSNGVIKDNTCNWYIYSNKVDPGGAYFVATVSATENNSSETSATETGVKSGESNKSDDPEIEKDKPKSCGVFALELPVLLLSGLVFTCISRKRKNN